MRSDFLVVGDNFELVVLSRIAPVAWLLLRLLQKKKRVPGCFTHHCSDHLSSCQLRWCHFCQLEVHEDELHHVELGDQLDEEDC